MSNTFKDQEAILKKLGIVQLNDMQKDAHKSILSNSETILLSPTGTGKTLAFLLPTIAQLDASIQQVQVLILVPSRELAIQIEQVVREMGSGFKANAVYGGRSGSKDRLELKHPPAILIGTPGRVADHLRREVIEVNHIKTLILDEFDKSLEVGFENEMKEIISSLTAIEKKVLTSATQRVEIPSFLSIKNPNPLDYLGNNKPQLNLKVVTSPTPDKLETLASLLSHIKDGNGIIFCSLKDTIQTVSDYLYETDIDHDCFYGGLDQVDRERALLKFRNGTHRILVATDLAARGIDVPDLSFIIHFQLPVKKEEFIHRNGRTARMKNDGTAYVMIWQREELPSFVEGAELMEVKSGKRFVNSSWKTLFISGGRKDKISKGDIAGLFFKQGQLSKSELGIIELKQDCAFVSIPSEKSAQLIKLLNNTKLKKKKVRISLLD